MLSVRMSVRTLTWQRPSLSMDVWWISPCQGQAGAGLSLRLLAVILWNPNGINGNIRGGGYREGLQGFKALRNRSSQSTACDGQTEALDLGVIISNLFFTPNRNLLPYSDLTSACASTPVSTAVKRALSRVFQAL
ncbi:hypothetical protein E5288_WYG018748 [Bos mutus]|uniref:Uncharacterized protein n=1 Tax=Bos mutus TaxID=72004 RepID=A0A6B0QZW0_9CETA|nr:hypothetical protein [Bos mutus]